MMMMMMYKYKKDDKNHDSEFHAANLVKNLIIIIIIRTCKNYDNFLKSLKHCEDIH